MLNGLANINATLGNDCWLGFVIYRLPLYKKRLASLGAQRLRLAARRETPPSEAPADVGGWCGDEPYHAPPGRQQPFVSRWRAALLSLATQTPTSGHCRQLEGSLSLIHI